jgi:S1-C subfamily serine protease
MYEIFFKKLNALLKKLLKLNLIILTIIVCAISINSKSFLEFNNLPEENFVNILQTKTLLGNCVDTGGYEDCIEEEILLEASASGVIFDFDDEFSYILTANHFCDNSDFPNFIWDESDLVTDFWITDNLGRTQIAEVVYSTSDNDLCLMKSKMKSDKKIILSQKMPKIGEKVYSIGAPHSIRPKGVSLHFEGIFSGCTPLGMCYYTIPATSGSSGSLVFDHKGRIIGMIQMTAIGFNAISIGSSANSIRKFLDEAYLESKISL